MAYTFPDITTEAIPAPFKPVDLIALLCQPTMMSPDDWRPVTMAAVLMGESGGNFMALGKVIWAPGKSIHLSCAFGLWQLLSYYHIDNEMYPGWPRMTSAQCLDPFEATKRGWALLNAQRTGWSYNMRHWSAYNNGSYKRHVEACREGMKDYRAQQGLSAGPF